MPRRWAGGRRGTPFARQLLVSDVDRLFAFRIARELKLDVYQLLRSTAAARDFEYAAQVRGAAASVEANVAAGFRRSRRDFARFLLIARSSLDEVEVRLADGVDRGHFAPERVTPLLAKARLVATAIMRLRRYLLDNG